MANHNTSIVGGGSVASDKGFSQKYVNNNKLLDVVSFCNSAMYVPDTQLKDDLHIKKELTKTVSDSFAQMV